VLLCILLFFNKCFGGFDVFFGVLSEVQ